MSFNNNIKNNSIFPLGREILTSILNCMERKENNCSLGRVRSVIDELEIKCSFLCFFFSPRNCDSWVISGS